MEAVERFDPSEVSLRLIITKSWALAQLGRFRESVALLNGAKQMADDEGIPFTRMRARFNLSSFAVIDAPHRGLQVACEGIAIGKQFGVHIHDRRQRGPQRLRHRRPR